MGPVTNALTSLTLARAGQTRLPRYGMAIMVVAGVAPDLDYVSYFGGPSAFLRFHRAVLHSVVGAVFVAVVTAGVFWALDKRRSGESPPPGRKPPLRFWTALIAAVVAIVAHGLLDVASGVGVQLLWPFRAQRYAWYLLTNVDIWMLVVLGAGLLIPELLRLVSEEIGERRKRVRGRFAAIFALVIFVAYAAARVVLHTRAIDLVMSSDYERRTPLTADAFPVDSAPLEWRGVAATDATIEEIRVSLAPGARFEPERSRTIYKPQDSAAVHAGEATSDAVLYLRYARFPLASVSRLEDGYRFEVHDLQFASGDLGAENTFLRVDLNSKSQIVRQDIFFAASPGP
ncbi:MAG: metal-dependent hydrolase [Candidatus Acidiferrales bacterium]